MLAVRPHQANAECVSHMFIRIRESAPVLGYAPLEAHVPRAIAHRSLLRVAVWFALSLAAGNALLGQNSPKPAAVLACAVPACPTDSAATGAAPVAPRLSLRARLRRMMTARAKPSPPVNPTASWRGQLIGDTYARHVVGSSRQTVDQVRVDPLLTSSSIATAGQVPEETGRGPFDELHLPSARFTADSDAAPGAQTMLLSKQGADRWHETFYGIPRLYLFQNGAGQSGQSYTTQRYGGSVSGPIRKGNTWFVADYLGVRQSVERLLDGYVPSPAFRASVMKSQPALAPILDAYPTSVTQSGSGSSDSMLFNSVGQQSLAEDVAFLRLDRTAKHGKQAHTSEFLRFDLAIIDNQAPLGGAQGYLRDRSVVDTQPYSIVLGLTHTGSPRAAQELRIAYLRAERDTFNSGSLNSSYTVVIPGLTTLNGRQFTWAVSNSYLVSDQVTLSRGRHTLKAGAEVRRVDLHLHLSDFGSVHYSSLANFAQNQVNWAAYSQPVPPNTLLDWQQYAWIQEDWKLRHNLLIGAGLRYEFYGRPGETHSKAVPFDFATCGANGFCPAGAAFNQLNPLNLDPRLSIAWAPDFGPAWIKSHVVLRAGVAVYHSPGLLMDQSQPVYNEVQSFYLNDAQEPGLDYPIGPHLEVSQYGIQSARAMNRHRPNPYATEWSLSAQTELPSRIQLTTIWFAADGTHLPTSTYTNLIDVSSHARPYPAFGQIRFFDNSNASSLNALAITATRYLPHGAQVMGGYNWAHEIDNDAAGDMNSVAPQNPACPHCERSSGDSDVRHSGGFRSYVPLRAAGNTSPGPGRFAHRLTQDWILLNDFSGSSALPVNVTIDRSSSDVATGYTIRQRPDRVPGVSLRPPHGPTVNEWINPAAFTTVHGLYGTAGRNIARGPGAWSLTTGLQRNFLLPRSIQFRFRITGQNILNHANYAQPFADWSTTQFGQIITPYSSSRQGDSGPRAFVLDFSFSH